MTAIEVFKTIALAARQKRQAEDEEQIKYLQEYNRKKREGKK